MVNSTLLLWVYMHGNAGLYHSKKHIEKLYCTYSQKGEKRERTTLDIGSSDQCQLIKSSFLDSFSRKRTGILGCKSNDWIGHNFFLPMKKPREFGKQQITLKSLIGADNVGSFCWQQTFLFEDLTN